MKNAAPPSKRRTYTDRMAERQFVRELLTRKVTLEVEAFAVQASNRSHQVRHASFLERFRLKAETAV
jgi:hypothetical protein